MASRPCFFERTVLEYACSIPSTDPPAKLGKKPFHRGKKWLILYLIYNIIYNQGNNIKYL